MLLNFGRALVSGSIGPLKESEFQGLITILHSRCTIQGISSDLQGFFFERKDGRPATPAPHVHRHEQFMLVSPWTFNGSLLSLAIHRASCQA